MFLIAEIGIREANKINSLQIIFKKLKLIYRNKYEHNKAKA